MEIRNPNWRLVSVSGNRDKPYNSSTDWRRAFGESVTDLRRRARSQTYKVGRIAFGDRRAEIGCVVRNISESGACLSLEHTIDIPDRFKLVFDTGEPTQICVVAWRRGNRVGVEFLLSSETATTRSVSGFRSSRHAPRATPPPSLGVA